MKRLVTKWCITCYGIFLVIMMTTVITVAFFKVNQETSSVTKIFATTSVAALTHVENLLKQINPAKGGTNEFVVKANLILSTNYSFFIRSIRPFWEKALSSKRVKLYLGFFSPIMVILMFSIFYQASRTSSERDLDFSF